MWTLKKTLYLSMEYFCHLFATYAIGNNFLGCNFIGSLGIYPGQSKSAICSSCIQTYDVGSLEYENNFLCCWDFNVILLLDIGWSIPQFIFLFYFYQYYFW